MEQQTNKYNKIFKYAFLGVLLCIATFGFTLTNFSGISMFQLPQTVIVSVLGVASVALLSKAIKADKHRLSEA